ncbi:MAG: DHH family phosphoesterase [Tenuifilaceae bacterium]|nr:DHH family phosphoesterase [Tenuifilaceae bacterium]
MKYELINPDIQFSEQSHNTIERVLVNRGIPANLVEKYLNTTDEDINHYNLLGREQLEAAYYALTSTVANDGNALLVIDSDADGYTSAAVLTNYLYDLAPDWVINHLFFFQHEGKQHGLADVPDIEEISLIIVPDAGSNDYTHHKYFADMGIPVIILDHHEAEKVSEDAIVINNQLSDYPNKSFSGVGIVWQFCRFLDEKTNHSYADKYIDLVALGNISDMMSLKDLETKHLITEGLKQENLHNPFMVAMSIKNSFSLGGKLTPIGVAFYITPFINAMVRSGTQEEKELLFKAMLPHEAFVKVPSTKRGHKPGDQEKIVDQAIRIVTNVKARQTKSQDNGLSKLESLIEERDLLENKVLLFQCESGDIPKNIAGLIANKFMAKYQRHTAILFRATIDGETYWRGSARGYSRSDIESFKDLCSESGFVEYAEGHASAFGLSIKDENIPAFIEFTNKALENDSGDVSYFVDYIYQGKDINPQHILDIAQLDYLWGQDIPEALIAIEGLKITGNMLTLMSPDKKPTLKITLPNLSIIKFKSSQEEYDKLYSDTGYVEINLVGTSNANEWNGNVTPQIFVKDYEIITQDKYYF